MAPNPKKPELPGCPWPECKSRPGVHHGRCYVTIYCPEDSHPSVSAPTLPEAVALWKKAAGGGGRT